MEQHMTSTTTKRSPEGPALVVHGLGEDRKPRAAHFSEGQAELATKAAGLMGLGVLKVDTPEVAAIAAKLPAGRVYSSGRGFVPPVRRDLYAKLLTAAGLPVPNGTEENARQTATPPGLPTTWDSIEVGHLVIAQEGPRDGWWEAIVVEKNDDMITLRWRDYPRQANVVRHRLAVALLHPNPGQ
jgi:hypothetical protein